LHEPLWFGKKGEGRIGFDYANSSWHRKLMDTSSGSGSGSNNEKRGRKDKHIHPSDNDQRHFGSSDSDTIAPPQMTEKRPVSESPIDPMMHSQYPNMPDHDHSPTHTLTTTLVSQHRDDSTRSLRHILTRSRSSEQRLEQERVAAEQKEYQQQQRILALNALHLTSQSPETEDFEDDIVLAPAPLRISRPPSGEHRPYTSDSGTHRAFHHPDYVTHPAEVGDYERPSVSSSDSDDQVLTFSYPGRLRSDGIRRTQSGREITYWPDGIEQNQDVDWDTRREEVGSRGSNTSRRAMARDAGRAY
jgi:hypothetical protein